MLNLTQKIEMSGQAHAIQTPNSPLSLTTSGNVYVTNGYKILHDRAQFRYLRSVEAVPKGWDAIDSNYSVVLNHLRDDMRIARGRLTMDSHVVLSLMDYNIIGHLYNWLTYLPPDPPLEKLPYNELYPLNPALDYAAMQEQYLASYPGLVVLDDFLTPEALASIQRLTREATVFWDLRRTYLGATMEHGFANRVLFRVVEELRTKFDRVLGGLPLSHCWAVKVCCCCCCCC